MYCRPFTNLSTRVERFGKYRCTEIVYVVYAWMGGLNSETKLNVDVWVGPKISFSSLVPLVEYIRREWLQRISLRTAHTNGANRRMFKFEFVGPLAEKKCWPPRIHFFSLQKTELVPATKQSLIQLLPQLQRLDRIVN